MVTINPNQPKIILLKDGHTFIFRFEFDHLGELTRALSSLVFNPNLPFDMEDALILTYQVNQMVQERTDDE